MEPGITHTGELRRIYSTRCIAVVQVYSLEDYGNVGAAGLVVGERRSADGRNLAFVAHTWTCEIPARRRRRRLRHRLVAVVAAAVVVSLVAGLRRSRRRRRRRHRQRL